MPTSFRLSQLAQVYLLPPLFIVLWLMLLPERGNSQNTQRTDAPQNAQKSEAGELYGGIEIGSKGIKATAIRVTDDEEGYNVKPLYAEVINTTLMQLKDNKFEPEVINETVQAVNKLFLRMRNEYRVPRERINIVGGSSLRSDNRDDLAKAVKEKTGKDVTFLDVDTEVQLGIVGTIPRLFRTPSGWTDNRGVSVLIDIGSGNTKGGYQVIRQMPTGRPDYDYVAISIPKGTVTFTTEVNQAVGEDNDLATFAKKAKDLCPTSIRNALRTEMERKPGLVNRQRVYLTGGIVWAMVTLLHPEDRRALVNISIEEIDTFHRMVTLDPGSLQKLLNPNLTKRITDPVRRQEVEMELESVRNTYTPRNLIAGAEILKAIASEFNLSGKTIRFARFSHLSWLMSYVRMQATL